MRFIPMLPVKTEFTAMLRMLSNAVPLPLKPKMASIWVNDERNGKTINTERQNIFLPFTGS